MASKRAPSAGSNLVAMPERKPRAAVASRPLPTLERLVASLALGSLALTGCHKPPLCLEGSSDVRDEDSLFHKLTAPVRCDRPDPPPAGAAPPTSLLPPGQPPMQTAGAAVPVQPAGAPVAVQPGGPVAPTAPTNADGGLHEVTPTPPTLPTVYPQPPGGISSVAPQPPSLPPSHAHHHARR